MTMQFFLQLGSVLGLSVLVLLIANQEIAHSQRRSSTIAIPVKVREDG